MAAPFGAPGSFDPPPDNAPRVLVAYASKMGGTQAIAEWLVAGLQAHGLSAEARPAREVQTLSGYDAVVVAGALYALRWHRDARRFVHRHRAALRGLPVWFCSSGPLDGSATERDIPPVRGVQRLLASVDARGHVTFGGWMPADATGFPASAMARDNAGDWRDPAHVARWADELALHLTILRQPS